MGVPDSLRRPFVPAGEQGFDFCHVHDGEDAVATQLQPGRRMLLGAPADIKDQPASQQPSPRPDGEGKSHSCRGGFAATFPPTAIEPITVMNATITALAPVT